VFALLKQSMSLFNTAYPNSIGLELVTFSSKNSTPIQQQVSWNWFNLAVVGQLSLRGSNQPPLISTKGTTKTTLSPQG
jgi:hypothetical protein